MDGTRQQPDVVAEALAYTRKAEELRKNAIEQLLLQRHAIDENLKQLGHNGVHENGRNGGSPRATGEHSSQGHSQGQSSKRFKNASLSEIGRILLAEHGTLHGKEIERLARAGGFANSIKRFQTYMPTAFKRVGGFENIGGNRWRLNKDIPPRR